ncbi:isocitrate lyase/phosphoenolpyruvate mutase family protein, partial [Escherichia coli]|nr:isocitrate lyase/phosphoenolpyruvate mutase family protein [Escherichia coli]
RTVCREVDRPVSVVMGQKGGSYTVDQLSEVGVRRISVGGSFARVALGALRRAGAEVMQQGTFTYAAEAIPDAEVSALMSQAKAPTRT